VSIVLTDPETLSLIETLVKLGDLEPSDVIKFGLENLRREIASETANPSLTKVEAINLSNIGFDDEVSR